MPRGNLEAIHPRALILSAVRKHLDRLKFKDAFMIMRKHRINMNLIYDHNPQSFLNNTEIFINQLQSTNHINLFLSDLIEEDVTVTMYTAAYNRTVVPNLSPDVSKIDIVSNKMKDSLYKIDSDRYLLSILTAQVKKSKPELEESLLLIKKLRDTPQQNQLVTSEEALKYLLFLVDVNELYDVALGTYDFDLVLMVAERSQKDPKEYLPFLNKLRQLETNYQRYTIDKYLKKYSNALLHIAKCGEDHFTECLSLVREHHLYSQSLELYPKTSSHYQELSIAYSEYLTSQKLYEEAGLIYCRAGQYNQALESFDRCLNWRQCFCMATLLKYTPEKVQEMARKLAARLKDHRGKHGDAGFVYEQYANDPEEAIVTLIEGELWEEALRLIYKHNRLDFLETNFQPALLEQHNNYHEQLDGLETDFQKYRKRLAVVREQKERERIEMLEGTGNFNDADADLFSDTSSATGDSVQSSTYTTSSYRSSGSKSSGASRKTRRKAEKKKWSLKEGSQNEDLALVDALAKIINRSEKLKHELSSLLKMLVLYDYQKEAEKLQKSLSQLLSVIQSSIGEIWLQDDDDDDDDLALGPQATANTISQAVRQGKRVTRSQLEKEPVLKVAPVISKDDKWTLGVLKGQS